MPEAIYIHLEPDLIHLRFRLASVSVWWMN